MGQEVCQPEEGEREIQISEANEGFEPVLVGFVCQLDTGWSYDRERSFSWGSASMRSSCGAFSQLVIKLGGPPWVVPSLADILGFYKRAG